MKNIKTLLLLITVIFFAISCGKKSDIITIGYIQIAQDPSLDYAKKGLIDALTDSGFVEGTNYKFIDNNAQGDISMIPTILQSLVSQNVDLIVTNSTPCMISAAQIVEEIPVVFTVAFSPEDMGINPIPENLFGVYDPYELTVFVDLITNLIPNIKKIGLPYNNSERNAEFSAKLIIKELSKRNIEVVTASVNTSNDILTAGNYLIDKNVEAIIVAADNVVNLGQALLGKIATENKIPLFVTEPMSTPNGVAIGYGVSYDAWGYQSGLKAVELLKGRTLENDKKITPLKTMTLMINKEAAEKQGLIIPDSLLKVADVLM